MQIFTRRKHAHAVTSANDDAASSQPQALEETLDAQRRSFARELHDEFGQRLALLKFHCHRMRSFLDHAGAPAWRAAEAEIDALISHVRSRSGSLHPPELQRLGLAGAIRDLLGRQFGHADIDWEFDHAGLPERLPASVELALYRIAQEAVTNIARHARAQRAVVRVSRTSGGAAVRMEISDDGVGCARATRAGGGAGSGQVGMRMRVEQVGGTLEVLAGEPCGTIVAVTIPLEGSEQ